MNNYRQKQKIVCPQCYYPDNDCDSKNCEICGASLAPAVKTNDSFKSKPIGRRFKLSRLYALLALILVSVGGFYLYKTQLLVARSDREQVSSDSVLNETFSMREVAGVPKGLFEYAGATTFAAMNSQLNRSIKKSHPGFESRYREPSNNKPGGSAGIKMLLDGEIAFAQSGRPLKQAEYDMAKSRGFALKQVPIAIDGIVFFVHPALDLKGLSLDRVREIFSGRITNWKQVSGPDLAVVPISTNPKSHVILGVIMGTEQPTVGANVKIVRDYTSAIRQTTSTPGAIAFASAAILHDRRSIKPLALAKDNLHDFVSPFASSGGVNIDAFRTGDYPLTRRLFVVYRLDGTPDEKAGVAYANLLMSLEAQKIAKEAGFAPLYDR